MSASIVLIGTLHSKHVQNPLYPPELLASILEGAAPKVILMDLPVDLAGRDGYLPQAVLEKDLRPEFKPVLQASRKLRAGVVPIDMAGFAEKFDAVNRRKAEANEKLAAWRQKLEQQQPVSPYLKILAMAYELGDVQRHFLLHRGFNTLNGEGFDRIVRMRHNIWHDLFPDILKDNAEYAGLVNYWNAYHQYWFERNRAMVDHIMKIAAAFKGKRMAVVVGVEHRYILRELLPHRKDIRLQAFPEIGTSESNV